MHSRSEHGIALDWQHVPALNPRPEPPKEDALTLALNEQVKTLKRQLTAEEIATITAAIIK